VINRQSKSVVPAVARRRRPLPRSRQLFMLDLFVPILHGGRCSEKQFK
jgi:hypothetical protein